VRLPVRPGDDGMSLIDADDYVFGRCDQPVKVTQAINAFVPLKLACEKALEVANLPHGVRQHIEEALKLAR
jgi:hypothetical protein